MADPPEPQEPSASASVPKRRSTRRRILIWGSASLALLLVLAAAGGYAVLRHFNTNIRQDNITGLLGNRPVNTHRSAENILVIGSDSRDGLSAQYGTGLTTDQSDTMMIIHIPADRQWAEVMSIPRDSSVHIPSCELGNGQMSAATQFKINEAFALGNLYGNHTDLGVACTVKTIEQDTKIFINHFVVVNFTGFENMVAALGGVAECNPTPINDPLSGLHLTAGHHVLTPRQALGYVRARYTLGDGSDLERIGRQQAFMSSLIGQVKGEMLNPIAIYKFLDAFTGSLTVDSQMGGITGLYNLGESLRSVPKGKVAFFTLPTYQDPDNTADVLWTQPEDNEIFASFRDDVPASSTLFGPRTASAVGQPEGTAAREGGHADPSKSSTASPSPSASATSSATPSSSASASPSAGPSASASPSRTSPSLSIPARTANQNICAG